MTAKKSKKKKSPSRIGDKTPRRGRKREEEESPQIEIVFGLGIDRM